MTDTAATAYRHIVLDDQGVPWIDGANTTVVELVAEVRAYGWSPEELAYQHPHLSLAQVHSALAFYWDHQSEVDAELERRRELAQRIEAEAGDHALADELRAHRQVRLEREGRLLIAVPDEPSEPLTQDDVDESLRKVRGRHDL
jgi:uncharacterized protein (DUF433 family)